LHRPVSLLFLLQGEVSAPLATEGNICVQLLCSVGYCMGKPLPTVASVREAECCTCGKQTVPCRAVPTSRCGCPAWRLPVRRSWYRHPGPPVTGFHLTPVAWGQCPALGSGVGGERRICWAPGVQILMTVISALHGKEFTSFLKVNMLVCFHSPAYTRFLFPMLLLHMSHLISAPLLTLHITFYNSNQIMVED